MLSPKTYSETCSPNTLFSDDVDGRFCDTMLLLLISTYERFVHPEKADRPMVVTLDGILIFFNFVQPSKAEVSITEMLDGSIIDISPVQPLNTSLAILVVPSFIIIEVLAGIVPTYLYATLSLYSKPTYSGCSFIQLSGSPQGVFSNAV